MSRRLKLIIGLGVVGVVAAAAFVYFVLLGGADDPVSLDEAVGAVTEPSTVTTEPTTDSTEPLPTDAPSSTTSVPPSGVGIDGTWTVAADLDSFVGYRVQEELDPIGSTTATGRTRGVTGSLEAEGATITGVSIVADLTQLESDRSTRDRAIRTRGLESNTFPEATFVLTSPISLDAVPAEGEAVIVTASGELTAHGVTNPVTVALEAQLVDGVMAVVGTIDVNLSDFEITGLTGFAVLSVEDEAQVEFQLLFSR